IAAFGIFMFIFLAEVGYYLIWRNQTVGLSDLGGKFSDAMRSFGSKKVKEVKETEGNVVLIDKGGRSMTPPADEDPVRQAYDALQSLLQAPMKLGSQRIDLRPTEGGSVQRYTVDGVTLEGKNFSKELASAAIELTKQLAGMDISDRRKPQTGSMKILAGGGKRELDIYTAGSTSGELMRLRVDMKKQFDRTIDTLGMLPDQQEQMLNAIADPAGVVLLTAPDGHGLTNLCYAVMRKHDAFLSHMQTLERDPQVELEGIRTTTISPGAPAAEEQKQIEWLISQEADVIYLDKCEDPRSAIDLARYAQKGRRVYIGMRAPTAFDALTAWRKLIGDDTLAMDSLKMIVAERLIRVLCPACKVAYTPDQDALKKMNMRADRVSKLYQARKEPMRDQKGNEIVCPFCHGLAYQGRMGVFEFFQIDDEVRRAILAGGTVNQLKALFRKQKQRYLQESALARVELGDTAVEEVLRVLRSSGSSSSRQQQQPNQTS
ncbi:MAG: Flp pilus assembly complex ATPase component TadA, partial [Burkholderiales bacterium]|nr:Flp pilus assembly complex ATPase component TadA [Phycisphaerae bacterium]